MDRLMDNPWFLRVVALLLAFLLFFSVKAEEDAATSTNNETEIFTDIPVEVYYDSESVVVTGVPPTVNVRVSGPTSVVQTTRAMMDFTLFVDLRNLTVGEHQVMIQTENLSDQLDVRVDPSYLNITIEERVTQEFRIEPEINEQLIEEGYVVESVAIEPEAVLVTGAKSAVESISFVKATITAEDGINESFTQEARVRVLDRDLKQPTVTMEPETVEATVTIDEYSREVPVSIQPSGEAQEGLTVNELTPSQESVRIFGPRRTVDVIEEYVVEVNMSVLSESETTIEVPLDPPTGTRSIAPDELLIEADVAGEVNETAFGEMGAINVNSDASEESRIFANIPIQVRGLNSEFQSTFVHPASGKASLAITGAASAIDGLTAEDFSIYVQADAQSGEQQLNLEVEGLSGVNYKVAPEQVTLTITYA